MLTPLRWGSLTRPPKPQGRDGKPGTGAVWSPGTRLASPPCVLILRNPTATLLRAGALPSGPGWSALGTQDGGRALGSWEPRSQGQSRHLCSPTRVPEPGSQAQTPDPTPLSAHRGGAQRGLGDWLRTCTGGDRAGRAQHPATGHSWTGAAAGRDWGEGSKRGKRGEAQCAPWGGGLRSEQPPKSASVPQGHLAEGGPGRPGQTGVAPGRVLRRRRALSSWP